MPLFTDDPSYKCPECDFLCRYWQDLVDHLALAHGWDPYKIDSYMNWVWKRRLENGLYR